MNTRRPVPAKRLTEADLDARELERISVPMALDWMPRRGCTGACLQGDTRCDCAGRAPYTWRALARDLARPLVRAWLAWEIDSAERWVAACVRDNITDSQMLRHQRRAIEALRVRLATWEA